MSQIIPDKRVTDICRVNKEGCCRYLSVGPKGFVCQKIHQDAKEAIDRKVTDGQWRATGDNCDGWGHPGLPIRSE